MCGAATSKALVILATTALVTSGCQTGGPGDQERTAGAFARLHGLTGREFTGTDVFVRGLWKFDGVLRWPYRDGYWLGCIQDRDAGCPRFVALRSEEDAGDLYARITGAPLPASSTLSTSYRESLRGFRTYVMGNDRPQALPEDPTLYDGPLSSAEAERTVRWLQGKVLHDRDGIVGGGKWVVGCWFCGNAESPQRLDHVYLVTKVPRGVFVFSQIGRWRVPVRSDGDVADLYHRVMGKKHATLKGDLSDEYAAFLEKVDW